MLDIFGYVTGRHDSTLLLVSFLICAFGSTISLGIGRRALMFGDRSGKNVRLCFAGVATGMTIWATHFSALLAYDQGVDVHFNAPIALASGALAILIAGGAWFILSVPGRWQTALGGGMIGLSLCAAHIIDIVALPADDLLSYDGALVLLSVALGFAFCQAAAVLIRRPEKMSLGLAASSLTAGIVSLHIVAMSAVRIIPDPASRNLSPLEFGRGSLTLVVIGAAALILLLGAGLALHDLDLARTTAADREKLRKTQEHHRFSVELNPQIPWIADEHGNVIEVSPRWSQLVGLPVEAATGSGWALFLHPDDLEIVKEVWGRAVANGDDPEAEVDVRYRLRLADGSYRWYRARAHPRRDEAGKIIMWYGTLEDIHEQVDAELALRASEERYRLASLAANDVIWDAYADSDMVEWAGAVEEVLGYPEAKSGTTREWWLNRLHPDEREAVLAKIRAALASGTDSWTQELRFRAASGQFIDLLSRAHVVRDSAGRPTRLVGSLMDITERKRSENRLRWAAHHDGLTRLPNRELFSIKLDAALSEARENGGSVGLIVIDVDDFKSLNDTLGHAAGDAALREIAARLAARVPPGSTVARLGGDEFAIILRREAQSDEPDVSLERVLRGIDPFINVEGRQVELSLSVGAAGFPADGEDPEALLKSADLALYAAKAGGPGRARRFQPGMREASEREKRMLVNAREALAADEIVPFYQPKICLRTGGLIGFESLLRWDRGGAGIQSPASIRAAFDDARLAPELTERMLAKTLADVASWLDQGLDIGRVALNGSAEDFRRGDLAERILAGLDQAGIMATRFELEITETVFLGKHADEVGSALRRLRAAGVTISLDDFGTGYASLTHLKQFPVDVLKIDKSFVSRLVSEKQQDAAIVGALIDLSRNLGMQTVAEGVETQRQASLLHRRGCDVGQGYFFARPLAPRSVPEFIRSWQPKQMLVNWSEAESTNLAS